jgi:hypothetical protein
MADERGREPTLGRGLEEEHLAIPGVPEAATAGAQDVVVGGVFDPGVREAVSITQGSGDLDLRPVELDRRPATDRPARSDRGPQPGEGVAEHVGPDEDLRVGDHGVEVSAPLISGPTAPLAT